MTRRKKFLITILFVLLIGILIAYNIIQINKQNATLEVKSKLPDSLYNQILPVSLSNKASFNIKSEIGLYSVMSKSISSDEAVKIASNLGINTEPTTVKDVRYGNTFLWQGQNSSLTIFPEIGKIEFNKHKPLDKSSIKTEKEFHDKEKDILGLLGQTGDNLSFKQGSYMNITNEEGVYVETDKAKAGIYRIVLTNELDGTPVLDIYQNPLSYVDFYLNGEIKKISVSNVEFELVGKTNTKTENQIKNSISQAKIYSLDNNGAIVYTLPQISSIKSIVVDKVELIYTVLREKDSITLTPMFLLNGSMETTTDSVVYSTQLFLPVNPE